MREQIKVPTLKVAKREIPISAHLTAQVRELRRLVKTQVVAV